MAGWYLVLILLNGHVTVNQHPMTEQGCEQQLKLSQEASGGDVKGACVEIK